MFLGLVWRSFWLVTSPAWESSCLHVSWDAAACQLMLSVDGCGRFGLEQGVEEGGRRGLVTWAQFCSCAIVVSQLRKHIRVYRITNNFYFAVIIYFRPMIILYYEILIMYTIDILAITDLHNNNWLTQEPLTYTIGFVPVLAITAGVSKPHQAIFSDRWQPALAWILDRQWNLWVVELSFTSQKVPCYKPKLAYLGQFTKITNFKGQRKAVQNESSNPVFIEGNPRIKMIEI